MQTRFRLSILFLITTCIIVSSCSKKTNKEGRYIPKTASFVFLMNGQSLSSKLPWEEIKQSELFKKISSDHGINDSMRAILENPDNSGIDIKKNLLFFIQKDSAGGYMAIEGALKDAAKFKTFFSSVIKNSNETEKDGIHFSTSTKMTGSWDKEKFIIVVDVPEMNQANKFRNNYDSSYSPSPVSKRDVIAAAAQIYTLPEDNSLAKDEKFSDLVNTKGDIHFWVSIGSLSSGNAGMAALSMLNMSKLYDGSFVTGVTNFDNGRIDVDIKSYAGKELTDIYKKYSGATINTDMIKRIPAKDVAGLFALSFKPEGLQEFIKLTGMEGFINMGAAQLGFTFDDFIKANKGDILISVSDLRKDSTGKPNANALFAASVGDKNTFGKLIEAGNKIGKEKFGSATDKFLSYNVSDNYFVLGTDKLSVDKFLSTSNNSNFNFLDKVSGSSSVFYLNFPLIMSAFGSEIRDSLDNLGFQATQKMWENLIATGKGFKDGASNQHIEFNLVDKNTNSLKQLNQYINTMGMIQEQKKIQRDKWMYDSTTPGGNNATAVDSVSAH